MDLAPYIFRSFDYKLNLAQSLISNTNNYKITPHLLLSDYWSSMIRQAINAVYCIISMVKVYRFKFDKTLIKSQNKVVLYWLKVITISMTTFFAFMLLYLGSLKYNLLNSFFDQISEVYLLMTWLTHGALIITIFLFPTILYGIPQINPDNPIYTIHQREAKGELEKKVVKTFKLEEDYLEKINLIIESYIKDAPYTKDKFSLSVLTSETKIPMHHLNLYFKDYLNTSFNVWKNKLKIEFAVNLINSGVLNQITIEALAMKSGFKSYSNFFTVFKDQMNVSPSEYIESLNNNLAMN